MAYAVVTKHHILAQDRLVKSSDADVQSIRDDDAINTLRAGSEVAAESNRKLDLMNLA